MEKIPAATLRWKGIEIELPEYASYAVHWHHNILYVNIHKRIISAPKPDFIRMFKGQLNTGTAI